MITTEKLELLIERLDLIPESPVPTLGLERELQKVEQLSPNDRIGRNRICSAAMMHSYHKQLSFTFTWSSNLNCSLFSEELWENVSESEV